MSKKNAASQILSSVEIPLIAAYRPKDGFPKKTVIASFNCNSCHTPVYSNNLIEPYCPSCGKNELVKASNETQELNLKEFKSYNLIGTCECSVSYVSTEEIASSLDGKTFHCVVCGSNVIAEDKPMEDDSSKEEKVTKDDYTPKSDDDTSTDNSDTSMDDKPEEQSEAEKELSDLLDKISTKESAPKMDDSPADNTPSTPDDKSDSVDEDNSDSKEANELLSSLILFKASLAKAKKLELVATSSFNHWYMFDGANPIAVASYENADESVKKVFRSKDFLTVFESAVAEEGASETVMKDFGFEPIKVNFDIDDISNGIINEKVAEKVKEADDKLNSLAELYDQTIGIASMGSIKGLFKEGNNLRDAFVSRLKAVNVRDPEGLVDIVLAKELPDYLRSIMSKAKELSAKSPEFLEAQAVMVTEASPRAIVKASTNESSINPPFSIVQAEVDLDNRNQEKSNLNRREATVTGASLMSNIRRGANRNG